MRKELVHRDAPDDEVLEDELGAALLLEEPPAAAGAFADGAGSRDEPPPLPPPEDEPADAPAVEIDLPWLTVALPKGKVSWYKNGNFFEARCKVKGHGRCALTRKAYRAGKSTGRPMGLMLAWLECDAGTHREHMELADLLDKEAAHPRREAARADWRSNPSAARLMNQEREAGIAWGESDEPLS